MRPARLLMIGALALAVYLGFFARMPSAEAEDAFDPAAVAGYEIEVWKALEAREEWGVYLNTALFERARHGYTWFRAAQTGYYLGYAQRSFVGIDRRFERVLPELETVATIERDWRSASFDPQEVAQAEVEWWTARKRRDQNTVAIVGARMAEEYAKRYGITEDQAIAAASLRAEALHALEDNRVDPNWPVLLETLTASYAALRDAIRDTRQARAQRAGS